VRTRDESIGPERRVQQLEEALATQPIIEQTKGMLMLLRVWTADEAFDALRVISQRTNVKLRDVAAVVATSGSGEQPALPDDAVVQAVRDEIRRSVLGSGLLLEASDRRPAGS
jgi:hypothetical protein